MAQTVVWTEIATEDLGAVAEFVARDSTFYAMALVREARASARSLRRFAERGRIVPECGRRELREIFVGAYRLIYRPQTPLAHKAVSGVSASRRTMDGAATPTA